MSQAVNVTWLLSKGWFTGDNVIGGKDVFMAVGSSGIKAPRGTPCTLIVFRILILRLLFLLGDLAEFVGKNVQRREKVKQ